MLNREKKGVRMVNLKEVIRRHVKGVALIGGVVEGKFPPLAESFVKRTVWVQER